MCERLVKIDLESSVSATCEVEEVELMGGIYNV